MLGNIHDKSANAHHRRNSLTAQLNNAKKECLNDIKTVSFATKVISLSKSPGAQIRQKVLSFIDYWNTQLITSQSDVKQSYKYAVTDIITETVDHLRKKNQTNDQISQFLTKLKTEFENGKKDRLINRISISQFIDQLILSYRLPDIEQQSETVSKHSEHMLTSILNKLEYDSEGTSNESTSSIDDLVEFYVKKDLELLSENNKEGKRKIRSEIETYYHQLLDLDKSVGKQDPSIEDVKDLMNFYIETDMNNETSMIATLRDRYRLLVQSDSDSETDDGSTIEPDNESVSSSTDGSEASSTTTANVRVHSNKTMNNKGKKKTRLGQLRQDIGQNKDFKLQLEALEARIQKLIKIKTPHNNKKVSHLIDQAITPLEVQVAIFKKLNK